MATFKASSIRGIGSTAITDFVIVDQALSLMESIPIFTGLAVIVLIVCGATLDVGDGPATAIQGEVSLRALHVFLGPLGGEGD